ncbi:MAG: HAMP domain-containing sensor histidine kinase [Pseudomonadota bacterium]
MYVITHDLSASFNHIKGFAEILSTKIADKIAPEDQLYFEHMILAVRKSEAMLSAITKLSHIPLQEKPSGTICLKQAIESVCEKLSPQICDRDAKIDFNAVSACIEMDKDNLELMLLCLIDNAMKFTPKEIQPEIEIETIEDKNFVILTITDNGRGINKEPASQFFDLFRKEMRGPQDQNNLGAGLAYVKEIVQHYNGSVSFVKTQPACAIEVILPITL